MEDFEYVILYHVLQELNGSVDALGNQGVVLATENLRINEEAPFFFVIP